MPSRTVPRGKAGLHRLSVSLHRLNVSQHRLGVSQLRLNVSQLRLGVSQLRLGVSQLGLGVSQLRVDEGLLRRSILTDKIKQLECPSNWKHLKPALSKCRGNVAECKRVPPARQLLSGRLTTWLEWPFVAKWRILGIHFSHRTDAKCSSRRHLLRLALSMNAGLPTEARVLGPMD